jgi:uncharacterized membrane protein
MWLAYLCDTSGAWITASLYEKEGSTFLLSVRMISSSILELQRSEWPDTLLFDFLDLQMLVVLHGGNRTNTNTVNSSAKRVSPSPPTIRGQ